MGRNSKLTEVQWEKIIKRHMAGESLRSLAKEFNISQPAISRKIADHKHIIHPLAQDLADIHDKVSYLPIAMQVAVHTLADELRTISAHLAAGARYSAATFHAVSARAHEKVELLGAEDDVDLKKGGLTGEQKDRVTLNMIHAYQQTANEAAKTGLNLLAVNKDNAVLKTSKAPAGLGLFYGDDDEQVPDNRP